MSRAPAKTVSMSAVTIGFETFLLPTNKAVAAMEILQHAVMVEIDFDHGHRDGYMYVIKDEARVEMKLVKTSQIKVRKPSPKPGQAAPLLLED